MVRQYDHHCRCDVARVQEENRKVIETLGGRVEKIEKDHVDLDKRVKVLESQRASDRSRTPTASATGFLGIGPSTVSQGVMFMPKRIDVKNFCSFDTVRTDGITEGLSDGAQQQLGNDAFLNTKLMDRAINGPGKKVAPLSTASRRRHMPMITATTSFTNAIAAAASATTSACPPTHRQHHTWAAAAQNKEKLKIGIVGAGLAGMIAAMDLADAGHDVEIFESRKFVGGKVARDSEEYLRNKYRPPTLEIHHLLCSSPPPAAAILVHHLNQPIN